MAPASRGDVMRPSKVVKTKARPKKGGTAHTRNHRFESFTNRISRLNVNPLRRNASANAHHTLEGEASHFKASFEEWCDLNMSETFVSFRTEVDPLCQSLPQIVHYETDIANLLVKYLDKRDELSLEPLLALVSHLAYDLGVRFEAHFARVVGLVADIAATHPSIEVIEWSFTCLAYLFKFLSRLLVTDLRLLFDLMAPFLGRSQQKHFVMRFAAESLSFLLKKAGGVYGSNKKPLSIIIKHAFTDLRTTQGAQATQYSQGLAFLFADAIKGIQKGTNANGATVARVLIVKLLESCAHDEDDNHLVRNTVEAVLVNVMHETDAAGFSPVLDAVVEALASDTSFTDPTTVSTASRVIMVLAGARQGSRISDWAGLIGLIPRMLDAALTETQGETLQRIPTSLQATAVLLQYAPFEQALPASRNLLESLSKPQLQPFYLAFCVAFEQLGRERFDYWLREGLQNFISRNWAEHEAELCIVLPRLCRPGGHSGGSLQIPQAWQRIWVSKIDHLCEIITRPEPPEDPSSLTLSSSYLELLLQGMGDESTKRQSINAIVGLLKALDTHSDSKLHLQIANLAFGKGLLLLSKFCALDEIDSATWNKIMGMAKLLASSPMYLHAVLGCIDVLEILDGNKESLQQLIDAAISNLASPLHDIRLASLEILQKLRIALTGDVDQCLQLSIVIERTAPTFENVREIAKDVRKLASTYSSHADHAWVKRAIPVHCFGLCHVQLTPVWDEAAEALNAMCQSKEVEEIVAAQAVLWLEQAEQLPALPMQSIRVDDAQPPERESADFQCTNLLGIDELFLVTADMCLSAQQTLLNAFVRDVHLHPKSSATNRTQALRILLKNTQLVEKRSRTFVSVFLKALAGDAADELASFTLNEDESNLETQLHRSDDGRIWDLKNRRTVLEILSKFVNPTVVFRTRDVFECLLDALCNGDVGIQKFSLKALMVWRPAVAKKYQENLLNMLDDSRFREELTTFLDVRREEHPIQHEDKLELMPILLRLLYGRIVARSGTPNARRLQGSRRKAVLLSVARLGGSDLEDFVSIALGPLQNLSLMSNGAVGLSRLPASLVPQRRLLGMSRLLRDILEAVPNYITPLASKLMDAIMYCYIHAADSAQPEPETSGSFVEQSALSKSTRHEALECLRLLFVATDDQNWTSYSRLIMDHVVLPRLPNLPVETAQGISAILRLFSTWSSSARTLPLLAQSTIRILDRVSDCLVVKSAREEVKTYILLDIFRSLFITVQELGDADMDQDLMTTKRILYDEIAPKLTTSVSQLIRETPGKDCLHACVQSLVVLGDAVEKSGSHTGLLQSSTLLLRQPLKLVGPAIKADLLCLLQRLVPVFDFTKDPKAFSDLWSTLAIMFSHLPSASDRRSLVTLFTETSRREPALVPTADLCSMLNALSGYRAGEPDYEKRLEAFNTILDKARFDFDEQAWEPLLHNMMFLIKDNEELSMRTSSSLGIQRFVQEATRAEASKGMDTLLAQTLIPALQRGMKEPSELIKAEYVAILTKVVSSGYPAMQDMVCLLGPDDESAFFNNILHIQQHRRARALRKLGAEADNVSSINISRFCMPLIEMFTDESEGSDANLAVEATNALGLLAAGLEWSGYRALIQRITGTSDTYSSKMHIRALGLVVQALTKANAAKEAASHRDGGSELSALAKSLPGKPALLKAVSQMMLPKIQEFVHYKDEATVDLRVTVALIAVRLIMLFDADGIAIRLPTVLIDVCNVLRSKAQEARDAARKTLAEMSSLIGSAYFSFILKQLRSSLERGSRLHVLSYTVHSLLVSAQPVFGLGDLDDCVSEITDIIIADIFGNVGQEKDAEGYVSKMKEVRKKNLSYDSMELLAAMTSVEKAGALVSPIRAQLDKLRPRLEKADELLRRLREGIRRNPDASNQLWLTLCYQIIKGAFDKADAKQQLTKPVAYKMATFGWDLLRRLLDKHEDLKSPAKLQGFLPLLDLSLRQGEEETQTSAIRLLTSIIKTPLTEIDDQAGDYIKAIKRIIEYSSSTSTPLAQAALRLLAALLRERPHAIIKQSFFETHIAFVLSKIRPDLNEPARSGERDRQVAAFNLLKAVLSRGVLIKEVYEVMEAVREVMITTSEHPIPDLARSVYSRFVLDYFPEEGKGFSKQLDFMMANLQYSTPNGRQAVMHVIVFLVNKMDTAAVQHVLLELFLPLVIVMASDDSEDCRQSARVIIRRILERASQDTRKILRTQLVKWLDPANEDMWKGIGFQCWEIYLDVHRDADADAATTLSRAGEAVESLSSTAKGDALDVLLGALRLLKATCHTFPSVAFRDNLSETWHVISTLVASKSPVVRLLSANLFTLYLGHFARHAAQNGQTAVLPLTGPHGLTLTAKDAVTVIEINTAVLQANVGADLTASDAVISNLAFLGRISAGGESQSVLDALIRNVANAVRFEAPSGSSLRPKLAALCLLQSLCKTVPKEALASTMEDTLLALNNLTDKDIPKAASMDPDESTLQDELTTTAQECLDFLQKMLGAQEFVAQMQRVQAQVRKRREERSAKRRIDAVAAPERSEKMKQRKHEAGKNKRREKNKAMAGRRRGW